MDIKITKRPAEKKSQAKQLRREGLIPAVLYIRGQIGETIAVPRDAFATLLRQVVPGHLSTTIFNLVDEQGKTRKAIIKDIQYEVTTYQVMHLDFEELYEDVPVKVKVPIECMGQAECMGIKLGGVLRQVIRHLRVSCLPKDIPYEFEIDVRELGLRGSKRLRDLKIPETIRPLASLDEVVAVIVKR